MASYPPYQQPILDGVTRLVTKPWQQFFLTLVSVTGGVVTLPPGSVPIAALPPIAAASLLGRRSTSAGVVETITLGTGLAMTGTVLSATAGGASLGYWTPITDGVLPIPELLFDAVGDCVVGFVPTP